MKLNVRKRIHFIGSINNVFVAFIAATIIVNFLVADGILVRNNSRDVGIFVLLVSSAILIIFSVFIVRMVLLHLAIKTREKNLLLAASKKGMRSAWFSLSDALYMVAEGKRDIAQSNSFVGDDWAFCDFHFSTYQRTKRGEYKADTSYFAVAAFALPRKLPNVFFDSRLTGGKEFKILFDQNQRHLLSADFDKYFDTYFHEDYSIDNLSFITSDVMLAIRDAKDYDVELFKDTLFLYSEMENMPYQLDDMEQKGREIRDKLVKIYAPTEINV